MKKITQSLDYEGNNNSALRLRLREWHNENPFQTGINWEFQYMWAIMTDELAFAFCLKYPEYMNRFKDIN